MAGPVASTTLVAVRPDPCAASLVVLVPAHDEEAGIVAAVESLLAQRPVPDRVVVVADNCTDRTEDLAREAGAEVIVTRDNTRRKAGALNQALDEVLPQLTDDGLLMVVDADCVLHAGFLAAARQRLVADPRLGGVGGTFCGGPGGGLVGTFQRNEYARYARDVRRLRGRALVLTGTATVFRVAALRSARAARQDGRLPDESGTGSYYDTHVLTEDNELTLALLHLGWRILAPSACTLETEVMPTWRDLARQRLRWKRGAVENLADYGWTPVTRRYWGRQLLSLLGIVATLAYLLSIAIGLMVGVTFHPFWVGVTGVFVLERVVTVHERGLRQMALATLLVPELLYDIFLQGVQARAFWHALRKHDKEW